MDDNKESIINCWKQRLNEKKQDEAEHPFLNICINILDLISTVLDLFC